MTEYYSRGQAMKNRGLSDLEIVGYTPSFINPDSEDDAQTQLHRNYAHGGGWHDFDGFTLSDREGDEPKLLYPGDPPTHAIAHWKLRDERIVLFEHAWVAIIQPDGSFRVARMD
jgi:hypothetical protein